MGNLGISVEFLPRGREKGCHRAAASVHARGEGSTRSARTTSLARPAEAPRARLCSCAVCILSLSLLSSLSLSLCLSVCPASLPRPPTSSSSEEQIHRARVAVGAALAYSHVSLLPVSLSFPPASRRLVLCLAPPPCMVSCGGGAGATRPVRCPVCPSLIPPSSSDGPAGAGAGRPASGSSCSCLPGGPRRALLRAPPHPVLPFQSNVALVLLL